MLQTKILFINETLLVHTLKFFINKQKINKNSLILIFKNINFRS